MIYLSGDLIYTRLVRLSMIFGYLILGCVLLVATGCGSDSQEAEAPQAANLGLARKGLSPSEVDIPCTQAEAEDDLKVASCRIFRHLGETVHLVGEIENTGQSSMGQVSIEAVGYADEDTVMDTKVDTAYIDPVPPGETTFFRVFFDARDVTDIKLTISGQPADSGPIPGLTISNVTISDPSSGYTHIKGEVNNPTADTTTGLFIAVLRDESGQVVEVHREKLIKPISSGASTFDVLALHHGAKTADVVILPHD